MPNSNTISPISPRIIVNIWHGCTCNELCAESFSFKLPPKRTAPSVANKKKRK
jgi:hypothetical protein